VVSRSLGSPFVYAEMDITGVVLFDFCLDAETSLP